MRWRAPAIASAAGRTASPYNSERTPTGPPTDRFRFAAQERLEGRFHSAPSKAETRDRIRSGPLVELYPAVVPRAYAHALGSQWSAIPMNRPTAPAKIFSFSYRGRDAQAADQWKPAT